MKKVFLMLVMVGLIISQLAFAQTTEITPIAPKQAQVTIPKAPNAIDKAISQQKDNDTNKENTNTENEVRGIRLNETCMKNGQCGFDIYKFLGIRTSVEDNNSPELFVQDILLSATFFIGTVVTLGIIVSGLMFVFAGATGKDPSKAKAGLKNSFIGLIIVVCSYSIIRVVQYIAKGF